MTAAPVLSPPVHAVHPAQVRRRAPSMRTRVTLWMVGITLVIFLGLSLVFFLYQRATLNRFFDTRIEARSNVIIESLRSRMFAVDDPALAEIIDFNFRFAAPEVHALALYNEGGEPLATTLHPAPVLQNLRTDGARPPDGRTIVFKTLLAAVPPHVTDPDPLWRVLLRRIDGPGGEPLTLLVAGSDALFETEMVLTRRVFLFTLPASVLAAGIAAWLVSGLALAPLRQLHKIADILLPEQLENGPVEDDQAAEQSVGELAEFQGELEEVRRRLRLALQAQDRFISNVSHELKTPVAVLLTEAQTLPVGKLPDETRRFVQSVVEEMRRLGKMVESFLTLTKLRGGKGLSHVRGFDLNDVLMDTVAECSRMAAQHRVLIEPRLAEGEHPPCIAGDAEMIRIMLDNLIRNSIRFSPERGRVEVGVHDDGPEWLRITVRDYGPGIPEDLLEVIFDRFASAPDQHRVRGHGLGLSIAQGVAEIHGGRINVRNIAADGGGGCEFTIRLPRATQPPGPPGSSSQSPCDRKEAEPARESR